MWTTWNIGQAGALLLAALLALPLAVLLSRAAYLLPRALDAGMAAEPSLAHRRWRNGFHAACLGMAMLCAWRFGATLAAVAAIVYTLTLLALAWVDAETGFLPDRLTLPLLWLGLLANLDGAFAPLPEAVLGAAGGYAALWSIRQLFLWLTGRVGMGDGDFKLLAALGAWLGWMSLPWVLLAASSSALVVALGLRLAGRAQAGDALRFGPYLAAAGILGLLRL
ncbi:prepilin peptidase [Pollutimonas bauzanensis]|uniref:Leader peptidase (Prepilin peptidase) / N-methyltransferase n=1 Tax=Pollutimonas bauzanensis TaxID=658167 RepID=A0A1M5NUA5_9BURK|nr:A24 family peptidase [Pollutimonas bauzanensis]SHG92523.1 leader peptidase (prepilin peptidase) / N-methyltransferase [Pollutimonas bauzanensis]